ncbi:MAG: hypothetical protein ACRD2C_14885 [Acidimicrobiales bacterium]
MKLPSVPPLARHAFTVVGVGVLALGVVAPPEHCPSATTDELHASASDAVDWFVRNQHADGTWLYLYEADTDTVVADYNVVRHAGAIMGLYQAASAEIPGALESADDGVDWIEDRLQRRDDWAAVRYQGQTPVGATALLVAGLAERREATGDDRYDDLLGELGRFLVAQVEPSGAVLAYADSTTGEPVPDVYSKYYTGEAWWAVARLHRLFPEDGWGEPASRIGTYVASERDDVEDYWPPLPDHWAAYGLDDSEGPLGDAEVAYARRQSELFGSQVRWVSQRFGPWGLLVRGPHQPRGGGYGVVGEALTGLWRVAEDDERLADLRRPLAERARCVAGLAIEAQTRTGNDQVRGAWFRDGSTRMDDQQHAISALLRTVAIVESQGEDSSGSDDPAPSAWLWAVALLAAVNPCRVAFDVIRGRNGSRGELVRAAARGGAVGALVVFAIALVSIPLLDVMNVSDPALRIAAGAVATGVGVAELAGRRSELDVPLAFAAPALVMLAVSARADLGVLALAVALAAGVGLVVAAVRWLPLTSGGGRLATWLGRLTAAVLAVTAIILVIDGIFDV